MQEAPRPAGSSAIVLGKHELRKKKPKGISSQVVTLLVSQGAPHAQVRGEHMTFHLATCYKQLSKIPGAETS